MKGFSRFLQLLCLLMFVAIVLPGGSEVGIAMDNALVIQKPLPPASPEILSFTATPTKVFRGEATILRWQVSGAEHIWISRVDRVDSAECIKKSSGEMEVSPVEDTNYRLHAWGGNEHVVQEITVQIIEPPAGVCSISGLISRDKKEYETMVNLYSPDFKTLLFSARVNNAGRYSFTSVPAGVYQVIPKGKYPNNGRDSLGAKPRSVRVLCQPNESSVADFSIVNLEG